MADAGNKIPKISIFLKLAIMSLFVSLPSYLFLFGGLPLIDWCIISDSKGRCLGLLFFIPKEWHLLIFIGIVCIIIFNEYPKEKEKWLIKQKNAEFIAKSRLDYLQKNKKSE